MSELLLYEDFMGYFLNVKFQTKYLTSKHNLRVEGQVSDDIVAFTSSNSSYIDQEFFIHKMKELTRRSSSDKTSHNYIVDISCMEIDWIINTN